MSRGFDSASRQVLERALRYARRDAPNEIGTEHLFRALVEHAGVRTSIGVDATRAAQLDEQIARCRRLGGLSPADADALTAIGIDLDVVVERVEAGLGVGALDGTGRRRRRLRAGLTTAARASLGAATAHAASLDARQLRPEHLLLGRLTGRGIVSDVLGDNGITVATVLTTLDRQARRAG